MMEDRQPQPNGDRPAQGKRPADDDHLQADKRASQRQKTNEQSLKPAIPDPTDAPDMEPQATSDYDADTNAEVEKIDEDVDWVEPPLDEEQAEIVRAICEDGRNVFYTDSGGVGKSLVLKVIVKRLKEMNKRVFKIAPTGVAALSIDGTTLHSYSGLSPLDSSLSIGVVMKSKKVKMAKTFNMSQTDVLIIDEISMVSHFTFQRLEFLLKTFIPRDPKNYGQIPPFGGIQLVVTGDFCQLPPVRPFEHCWYCGRRFVERVGKRYVCEGEKKPKHPTWIYTNDDQWAFQAPKWKECNFQNYNLKTIHRQTDKTFISALQNIRLGIPLDSKELELLKNNQSGSQDEEFKKLTTATHTYQCVDDAEWGPSVSPSDQNTILNRIENSGELRYKQQIELKEGMPVVLLRNLNLELGLVNGAQGHIIGFRQALGEIVPEIGTGSESRKRKRRRGKEARHKDRQMEDYPGCNELGTFPIVKFLNGQEHTIFADCIVVKEESELENDPSLVSRCQIPLTPGWAVTIHKSQGLTLDRLVVDLSRSFERGQVYVALSRVRTLAGLTIKGRLDNSLICTDQAVLNFLTANGLLGTDHV